MERFGNMEGGAFGVCSRKTWEDVAARMAAPTWPASRSIAVARVASTEASTSSTLKYARAAEAQSVEENDERPLTTRCVGRITRPGLFMFTNVIMTRS